jgi:hypothetical protein
MPTTVRVAGYGITGTPYENSAKLTVNVGGLNPGQTTWTLIAEGPGWTDHAHRHDQRDNERWPLWLSYGQSDGHLSPINRRP